MLAPVDDQFHAPGLHFAAGSDGVRQGFVENGSYPPRIGRGCQRRQFRIDGESVNRHMERLDTGHWPGKGSHFFAPRYERDEGN